MPPPPLSDEALRRLRGLIQAARPHSGSPSRTLIGHLAGTAGITAPVTIDFTAEATLGQPLVIVQPTADPPPCFATLTEREHEVAALLAAGLSNKEIATRLFISVATVKDHVHHILERTGLDSRAAVAATWHGHRPT